MTFTLNITANLPENPIMLNVVIEPESEHPAMIGGLMVVSPVVFFHLIYTRL